MSWLEDCRAQQQRSAHALINALCSTPSPGEPPVIEQPEPTSFDGGARITPPRAISHGEVLAQVLTGVETIFPPLERATPD